MGLAQPILYLSLFGPLLEPLAASLGTDNAYQLFVPGLLVDGVRAVFRGDFTSGTAIWGLVLTLALVGLGVLVGTRTFRRESS